MPICASPCSTAAEDPKFVSKTISLRSTTIDLPMLTSSHSPARKTKLGFTVGPACDDEEVRMCGYKDDKDMPEARPPKYPYPACP